MLLLLLSALDQMPPHPDTGSYLLWLGKVARGFSMIKAAKGGGAFDPKQKEVKVTSVNIMTPILQSFPLGLFSFLEPCHVSDTVQALCKMYLSAAGHLDISRR